MILVGVLSAALAGVAVCQSSTLDGRPITVYREGEALEIRERNPGLPDNWDLTKNQYRPWGWTPGAPVTFDDWRVTAPGYTILAGGFYGARDFGGGSFQLAAPTDFKYPARRNGVELWPGTETHHRILPGDTLYARLVPVDDPWETRMLAREVTQARRTAALRVLRPDEARIARWPWLQKVFSWYRYDASALDPSCPIGQRTEGWLLVPQNFIARWGAFNPGGLPAIAHWYGLGSRQAGVSLTNENYDSAACWILEGLRTNDPATLTVGFYLVRLQGAYGLVDCDQPCRFKGLFRTESGSLARGTEAMVPGWAKGCFGRGAWAADVALGGSDTFIHHICTLHGSYLLTCGHEWQGAGGARNIGRFLGDLEDAYLATGDDRFRARAASEIAYAMGIIGTLPYCPENPGSTTVSAGEGLTFLANARWWALHGAGAQYQAKLDAMLAWYVAHAWDPNTGRVGYFLDATTGVITWSGDFQGAFWGPIPGLDPAIHDKIDAYMNAKYAGRTDVDAAFGGEGPGWFKWPAIIVSSGGRAP